MSNRQAGKPLSLAIKFAFLLTFHTASNGVTQNSPLDIEWAVESSREIPWYEAESGTIVRDKVVKKYSLFCSKSCSLTVISFPSRNCGDRSEIVALNRPLLEATQAGMEVDIFQTGKNRIGELSVTERPSNSIAVEYTSHELHNSKISILVNYRDRFGPGASKIPEKITGIESGIGKGNSLAAGGDEIVKFQYRQLPSSTVCFMNMQSRNIANRK